jgi:hypothetical protein
VVAATTSEAAHASAGQAASIEYGNFERNAPATQQTDELVAARLSVVEGTGRGKRPWTVIICNTAGQGRGIWLVSSLLHGLRGSMRRQCREYENLR